MIRKVDELGRIVLPMEFRKYLNIETHTELEIEISKNNIILSKVVYGCIFCNGSLELVRLGNYCVCRECIERLHEAKDGDYLYPINRN